MVEIGAKIRARLVMEEWRRDDVYPTQVMAAIDRVVDLVRPSLTAEELAKDPHALGDVEVLLTGWGAPVIDAGLLANAPRLRAVMHAAGSVKHIVSDDLWQRGITVVSAASANAEPVAEVTAAQIVLAARGLPSSRRAYAESRLLSAAKAASGTRGKIVGLVALGEIGRRVAERLRGSGLTLIAADPYVGEEEASALGVALVELTDLFARADVVSLHAPLLPSTEGMIGASLIERMPESATLINTARGGLIAEDELIKVLRERPDLTALLDVTVTEPPARDSELWNLSNIELTPHVAGSMGEDRAAMGWLVADELSRLAAGVDLRHQVNREMLDRMA